MSKFAAFDEDGTRAAELAVVSFFLERGPIWVRDTTAELVARARLAPLEDVFEEGFQVSIGWPLCRFPETAVVAGPVSQSSWPPFPCEKTVLGVASKESPAGDRELSESCLAALGSGAAVLAESSEACGQLGKKSVELSRTAEFRFIGDVVSGWLAPEFVERAYVPERSLDPALNIVLFAPSVLDEKFLALAAAWAREPGCGSIVKVPVRQALKTASGNPDAIVSALLALEREVARLSVDLSMGPSCKWAFVADGAIGDGTSDLLFFPCVGKPVATLALERPRDGLLGAFFDLGAGAGAEEVEAFLGGPVSDPKTSLGERWPNREIGAYVAKFAGERAALASVRRSGMNISSLRGSGSGRAALLIGNGRSAEMFSAEKLKEALGNPVVFAFNRRAASGKQEIAVWVDAEMNETCSAAEGLRATYAQFAPDGTLGFAGHPWPADVRFVENLFEDGSPSGDRVWEATSGGVGIQLAALFGCDPIVLLGFDCARCLGADGSVGTNSTWAGKPGSFRAVPIGEESAFTETVVSDSRLEGHARMLEKIASELSKRGKKIVRVGYAGLLRSIPVDEHLTDVSRVAPRRVLLTRGGGGVGDALQMTPVVRAWKERFPRDFVTVATNFPEVFENSPRADSVVRISTKENLDPGLIERHELVVRLDWAIGRTADGSLRPVDTLQSCADSYFDVAGLPLPTSGEERLHEVFPTHEDLAAVAAFDLPDRFVAVNACYRSKKFRMSANEWELVVEALKRAGLGPVVAVGTARDFSPKNVDLDLVGKTKNVRQLAEVFSKSSGAVLWDSGPLHVAACCPRVPVCCVFANRVLTGSWNVARRAPALNPFGWVDIVRVSAHGSVLWNELAKAAVATLSGDPVWKSIAVGKDLFDESVNARGEPIAS